jgi:hypothetical protein
MPPNANIFQPGPAFVFVTVNGTPSNGTYVIVGSGKIETQTMNPVDTLPSSVLDNSANGNGNSNNSSSNPTGSNGASSLSHGAIGGIVAAAVAVFAIFGTILGFFFMRRRRVATKIHPSGTLLPHETGVGDDAEVVQPFRQRDSDSTSFAPLQRSDMTKWGQSRDNLVLPSPYPSGASSGEFDPYDPSGGYNASAVGLTRYR